MKIAVIGARSTSDLLWVEMDPDAMTRPVNGYLWGGHTPATAVPDSSSEPQWLRLIDLLVAAPSVNYFTFCGNSSTRTVAMAVAFDHPRTNSDTEELAGLLSQAWGETVVVVDALPDVPWAA